MVVISLSSATSTQKKKSMSVLFTLLDKEIKKKINWFKVCTPVFEMNIENCFKNSFSFILFLGHFQVL